jgi:hypothetical protein
MKNWLYISIIIVCLGVIGYGLITQLGVAKPGAGNQSASDSGATAQPSAAAGAASSAPRAIGQVAEHFRPDAAQTTFQPANANFQPTSDLLARLFLVDKFKPGICFGIPTPAASSDIAAANDADPPLSDYVRKLYGLTSDLQLYDKLTQLNGISLIEIASSKFAFTLRDGQCQNITTYTGTVEVMTGGVQVSVASQTMSSQ